MIAILPLLILCTILCAITLTYTSRRLSPRHIKINKSQPCRPIITTTTKYDKGAIQATSSPEKITTPHTNIDYRSIEIHKIK